MHYNEERKHVNAEIFLESSVKGGKSGFPKIEGGQQHLANGKVIQLV